MLRRDHRQTARPVGRAPTGRAFFRDIIARAFFLPVLRALRAGNASSLTASIMVVDKKCVGGRPGAVPDHAVELPRRRAMWPHNTGGEYSSGVHGTDNGVAPLLKLLETPLSIFGKAAIVCIIALAILAWMPAQYMTRTTLGGHAEHFIAWLGTALVFGLASRPTARVGLPCILLVSYAAVLECGQLYALGRDASFYDFAFSAAGVMLGSGLIWFARVSWLRSRRRPAR